MVGGMYGTVFGTGPVRFMADSGHISRYFCNILAIQWTHVDGLVAECVLSK